MALDANQIIQRVYDSELEALRIATDGPAWTKYTYTYDEFTDADTATTINGPTLPAGTIVHAVKVKHSEAFAAPDASAAVLDVGITGTAAKYIDDHDLAAEVSESAKTFKTNATEGSYGAWCENHSSTTQVIVTVTLTGDNCEDMTAGSVDVLLLTSVAT